MKLNATPITPESYGQIELGSLLRGLGGRLRGRCAAAVHHLLHIWFVLFEGSGAKGGNFQWLPAVSAEWHAEPDSPSSAATFGFLRRHLDAYMDASAGMQVVYVTEVLTGNKIAYLARADLKKVGCVDQPPRMEVPRIFQLKPLL